ncbi:WS/DGAT domain-containing protein [Sphingomonas sp. MMS24-JH45]
MYGTGPVFDGMGLINPVYSYGDTIAVSFTSDRDIMPDPTYAAGLRAAFEGLKAATLERPAAAPVDAGKEWPLAQVVAQDDRKAKGAS